MLNSLGVLNSEHILYSIGLSSLQILQSRLNASQTARHNLLPLTLEPTLLQALCEVAHVYEAQIIILRMHGSHHGPLHSDTLGLVLLALCWQHRGEDGTGTQGLGQVDIAALFADGVVGIQQLRALGCLLDALDHGIVARAVVNHGIAFALVQERLYVVLGVTRHANEWVDAGAGGELDGVDAYGGCGAVDDQRGGFGGGAAPGLGEGEVAEETHCGGKGG